jgi:WD40 repeat protein
MPRPERHLDPSAGPVQLFAHELRHVRRSAGNPPYREMARQVGYSATTLSDAAGGRRLPNLAVVLAYVRACGGDTAQWQVRWKETAAAVSAGRVCDDEPPYLGLAVFQPEHADRFFGREQLVAELTGHLAEHRMLALVGASGSGKSSLLRAGLLPSLGAVSPGSGVLLVTPGEKPYLSLVERLAGAPPGAVIAVDQFEEAFTQCAEEAERDRFFDALLDEVESGRSRVVIAVRADFYGHCAAHRRLSRALRGATVLVGPMSDDELQRAIVGPAALAGLTVERALVTKVLDEARRQPGALPLVSHALLESWRLRQGQMLTLERYAAAGGVGGAIAQTAERVYRGFGHGHRLVARQVLTRLTTLGDGTEDTRRRVRVRELAFDGADEVIRDMVAARLLVVDEGTVEIAHEALISAWPRLRRWLTEDRDGLRVHRRLTEAAAVWAEMRREPGALYRGARLAEVREWLDRDGDAPALSALERAFVTAGVDAENRDRLTAARRNHRLRVLTAALGVLLLLAVTGGVVAIGQWREAAGERQRSLSRQFAAQAQGVARTDAAAAARLALRAYRTQPTTEALGALLSVASRPPYTARLAHEGLVKDVAFSPAGTDLVTASQDGSVSLWESGSHRIRAVLTGHAGAVRAVAYHPDGRRVASGGLDGTVIVWDTTQRRSVLRLDGGAGSIDAVAFSPRGDLVAAVTERRSVVVWRVADGAVHGRFHGSGGRQADLAFTADGSRVVAGGDGGTVVLWDVRRRLPAATIDTGQPTLYAVAVSPDGRHIATGGADPDIGLWDAATGRPVATLRGHTAAVRALAFGGDGATLVSGSYDETAAVWDVARRKPTARLTGHTSQLYGVAISRDGTRIATAGRDRTVLVWQQPDQPLSGQVSEVLDVSVSADGTAVASSANDGAAVVWDAPSRRRRASLPAEAVLPAATQPAGGRHLITRRGRTIVLWDAGTARPVRSFTGHTDRVLTGALHPSRPHIASGAADRTVRTWDITTGAELTTLTMPDLVQRVVFADHGATLMAASRDGTVTFWDTGSWQVRTTLRTGSDLADAALSPSGSLLATGGGEGTVDLWNVRDRHRTARLAGHAGPIGTLAFSPDGRLLASGGFDRTVVLWDPQTGAARATLTGHTSGVTAATWSPGGAVLYTGGPDRTVIPWIVDPAQAVDALCRRLRTSGHSDPAGCP